MTTAYVELYMDQGADFYSSITINDITGNTYNLIGYTAASQFRTSYYNANVAGTFVVSTGNDPTQGILILSLDSANTANVYPGRYVYDVYVNNTVSRVRVLEGIIEVTPQVTKLQGML